MGVATPPPWAKPLFEKLEEHSAMLKAHGELFDKCTARLDTVEGVYSDIADIRAFTKKSWNVLKFGAPSIISGLLAAGWVSGDIAAILRAIFS